MSEIRSAPAEPGNRFIAYGLALAFGLFQALSCFPLPLIRGQILSSVQSDPGDFLQHIIGQIYFLHQDWHWPLLVDQRLDAPAGTSIAMTDSIPLEALFLKLVHPLFPNLLQGITLFLALSWMLQPVCAVFALRSLGEKRLLPALGVAVLSACFPTFLSRLGHAALCGHWILLLALGLYFRSTRPGASHRALLALSLLPTFTFLVHPYLMVMVGAILAAVPLTLFIRDRSWKACRTACVATVMSGILVIITGSVLGYWGGTSGGGYGFYSMNLASPFWPVRSSLFPPVSAAIANATGGQDEGYQYLGAGILGMLFMVLLSRRGRQLARQLPRTHGGLLLACLGLTLIALSNRIYLFHIPVLLTHFRVPGAEQMRASGRMFWPVGYLLLIGAVYGLCRAWPRIWAPVLLVGMLLQWADTRDMRNGDHAQEVNFLREATSEDREFFGLFQPFSNIEIHPRLQCDATDLSYDMRIIYAAARQNATVNTMYAARDVPATACHMSEEGPHALDPKTLIVLTGPSRKIHAFSWEGRADAQCGTWDKAIFCVAANARLPEGLTPVGDVPAMPLDTDIATNTDQLQTVDNLESGWSGREAWGTWSEASQSFLYLPLPKDVHTASLTVRAHSTPGQTQQVRVSLNGTTIAQWTVKPEDADYEATFTVPPGSRDVHLHLDISHPVHIGQDPRLLGIGLLQIKVHKLS